VLLLIAFLNDEEGAELVEALLFEASIQKVDLLMNKVNLLEIYMAYIVMMAFKKQIVLWEKY
jgi:hypothetical protein